MRFFDYSWLTDKKIILLSPHHDDIALSSGGVVRNLRQNGRQLFLINVFTTSLWAPILGSDATKEEISCTRLNEDTLYCQKVGIESINLGFEDSMVRGYDAITELSAEVDNEPIYPLVEYALLNTLNSVKFDLILCPLAIGNHIDHKIVQKAMKTVCGKYLMYYEDLPYSCCFSDKDVLSIARIRTNSIEPGYIDISGVIGDKIKDIQTYASQIEDGLIDKVVQYSKRFDKARCFERIWFDEENILGQVKKC